MNLEEPNQMCSNSNSGVSGISRCSKKHKQKKIPQRGLGVAQLEKIRIEELQKKDSSANSIFTSPPVLSPSDSSSLPMPLLNYSTSHSSSTAPFPSLSPILGPPPPMSNIDSFYLNSVPQLSHSSGGGGFDVGWPSVPTFHDSAHLHKMWHSYELNRDGENSRWDHGLPLPLNMSLPFESSPIMPLPDIMTRVPQFSQTSASSLMNMPWVNSSTILNFQMEPPSNQSLYSKFSSFWPGEEKMASAKRPYPFLLGTAPPLPFQSKLPRITSITDEYNPFGNGSVFNSDHVVLPLRENRLLPSSSTSEPVLKNINKEVGNQNVDFLTLAPPPITSPHQSPRWRHSFPHRTVENPVANSPRAANLSHRILENPVPNLKSGPSGLNHINVESPSTNSGKRLNDFNHQQSFFSFLPASKLQQERSTMNSHCNSNGNSEVGSLVDLNLKL